MLRAGLLCLFLACPAQADLAVITSQTAGRLSFLDTETGTLRGGVDLPGQPAALAVRGGHIAVVAVATKTLHLLDLNGQEVARRVFPGAPFGVSFDQRSGDLLVTDAAGDGALHRLALPDLHLRESLAAAANPTGIDSDASGTIVLAARDADLALIYPPDCQSCTAAQVAVGHHPFGVTLHEGKAFVTNVLSDDVSVIDLATRRETARIKTGARPYAVAFARGRGFVSNQYDASLTVFDSQDYRVITTISTGDYPEGVAATDDGKIVVASWFSDLVQVIDAESLQVLHEAELPEGPRAFGRFITLNPAP